MPQINRIRVNNVKYNFGTQYYDDFFMNLNCSNTLYDLANGGGKSLLMLLLLQNVIPNSTLDDKQPVEKLFRDGNNNSVIHSLIEWKLDSCFMRDGYCYMTTGFCARKLGTGHDENNDENENTESMGNSGIEYFNYLIFYREFNDNDIRNLPLTNDGERITYNGLKNYLKDLHRNDNRVTVLVFDRKGEYMHELTKYGIYESHWEIIRGINKTEGHVRTYFENNYKTSRKVIEDLLIEGVIQKSFANRIGQDDDALSMTRTLIDIKDQLIDLSKKHMTIGNFDKQIEAIKDFATYTGSYRGFFDKKKELEDQLYKCLILAKRNLLAKEKDLLEAEKNNEVNNSKIDCEQENIMAAEIAADRKACDEILAKVRKLEASMSEDDIKIAELGSRLVNLEAVDEYEDYLEYEKELKRAKTAIEARLKSKENIAAELAQISITYHEKIKPEKYFIDENIEECREELKKYDLNKKELETSFETAVNEHIALISRIDYENESARSIEKELALVMESAGILVPENAEDGIITADDTIRLYREKKAALEEENENLSSELENWNKDLVEMAVKRDLEAKALAAYLVKKDEKRAMEARLTKLKQIYANKANLTECLKNGLDDTYRDYYRLLDKKKRMLSYLEGLKKGIFIIDNEEREKLLVYLKDKYDDLAIEASYSLAEFNDDEQACIRKRIPFIDFCIVFKGDFEELKSDLYLAKYAKASSPLMILDARWLESIASKQEMGDSADEYEGILILAKDSSLLFDEGRKESEIRFVSEELDELEHRFKTVSEQLNLIMDDYNFVIKASQSDLIEENSQAYEQRIKDFDESIEKIKASIDANDAQIKTNLLKIEDYIAQADKSLALKERLQKVIELRGRLADIYHSIKLDKQKEDDAAKKREQAEEKRKNFLDEYAEKSAELERFSKMKEKLDNQWRQNYEAYYTQDDSVKISSKLASMNTRELEARFFGLKEVLEKGLTSIEDKEALVKHYKEAMEKALKNIEYKGTSLETVKRMVENGLIEAHDPVSLKKIKDRIKEIKDKVKDDRAELEASRTLMNRIEGSIEHAVRQIEDKYGCFRQVDCDNPAEFIRQHKELLFSLKEKTKELKNEIKAKNSMLRDAELTQKDLARIITAAGLTEPILDQSDSKNIKSLNEKEEEELAYYSKASKEYESHKKLIEKKKDEFMLKKQVLVTSLEKLDAEELAIGIRDAISLPSDSQGADELSKSLMETVSYIVLEKERISDGIADMEKIKDSFENRCIQTCCNIKTELERLHSMSNVSLDGKQVSVVALKIPYVSDEVYKERMSAYIDETVSVAESSESREGKVAYIQSRLSWKRLFSVIVTDPNAMKVFLYKRERIKENSRFLKYEEAVGSTGQSQGIYIQFLIAVINYISGVNAPIGDSSVLLKTIFIDNPFGAAKDIYIWEPIFALLKTNHVQLIVPARGATPAITSRFDVNYILGQKMVDKRLATVVVDYSSKTDTAKLDYQRMEFEQQSFIFAN